MKIELYYIGKPSKNIYEKAESEFVKRLGHYCHFKIIAIRAPKHTKSTPVSEILKEEAQIIRQKTAHANTRLLLDEKGKTFSSRSFARKLESLMINSPTVAFIIGGAYGFDPQLKSEINEAVSLSCMTFPHHLARLVFVEQLYRAFSILNNSAYHND